jgi:hypothetical protein
MKGSIGIFSMLILLLISGCGPASDEDSGEQDASEYIWYRIEGTMSWENQKSGKMFTGTGELIADLYFENDGEETKPLAYYYVQSTLNSYGGSDGVCRVSTSQVLPTSIAGLPILDSNTLLHTDIGRLQVSLDKEQSMNDFILSANVNCGLDDTFINDYPFYKLLAGLKTEDLVFDITSGIVNKEFSYDMEDPSGTFYEEMSFTVTDLGITSTSENGLNNRVDDLSLPSDVNAQ